MAKTLNEQIAERADKAVEQALGALSGRSVDTGLLLAILAELRALRADLANRDTTA